MYIRDGTSHIQDVSDVGLGLAWIALACPWCRRQPFRQRRRQQLPPQQQRPKIWREARPRRRRLRLWLFLLRRQLLPTTLPKRLPTTPRASQAKPSQSKPSQAQTSKTSRMLEVPSRMYIQDRANIRAYDAVCQMDWMRSTGGWSLAWVCSMVPDPGPWSRSLVPGPSPWSRSWSLVPGPGPWYLAHGGSWAWSPVPGPRLVPRSPRVGP